MARTVSTPPDTRDVVRLFGATTGTMGDHWGDVSRRFRWGFPEKTGGSQRDGIADGWWAGGREYGGDRANGSGTMGTTFREST